MFGAVTSLEGGFLSKKLKTNEYNIAPENGWLEYQFLLGGWPIFRRELLVAGSVANSQPNT